MLIPLSEFKLQYRVRENFENLCDAYSAMLGIPALVNNNSERVSREKLLARQYGTPPSKAYIVIKALHTALSVDGDICEFGVAQGEFSTVLANEIYTSNKVLHLFDSFQGLPQPGQEDKLKDDILQLGDMAAYGGKMASSEALVLARLSDIGFPHERIRLHKGFFEELLKAKTNFPERISFAYIDFDFYTPIKEALNYLDAHSDNGAVFVVDDYDYFSTGAKKAVDEFLNEKGGDKGSYISEPSSSKQGHCIVLTKRS